MKNFLKKSITSFLLIAVFVVTAGIAIPQPVRANHAAGICATETGKILAEEGAAAGVAAGFAGTITAIKTALSFTNVPAQSKADIAGQTLPQGVIQQSAVSSKLSNISKRLYDTCLKAVGVDMAQAVINLARDQILTWINTGNFGGKPTFITNFEFDAKKTAENAARIFASELTNIDFCNYFPVSPAVNLDFQLNARLGLECSFQKSRQEYREALKDPGLFTTEEKIAMFLDDATDPLLAEINAGNQLATAISQKKEARRTDVTSGKGFIGIETCVEEVVERAPAYYYPDTGFECEPLESGGIPPECVYDPGKKVCKKTEKQTPGSFVADLATEPLKSELREKEIVNSLEQAIAVIVNAAVGKVINKGLNKAFGP